MHGPELGELAAERPGDLLEKPRGRLVEGVRLGERPCHAVLNLQAGLVTLALGAQVRDHDRHRAADGHHDDPGHVRAAAEGVGHDPGRHRDHEGEQRHGGGVTGGRAGGRDQRTRHEQLGEHRRVAERGVDDKHDGHRGQPKENRPAAATRRPPSLGASPTWARILR